MTVIEHTMPTVSPLFAIEADAYYSEGRLDEALKLCRAGLAQYPEYATAYALEAKILDALGRSREAKNAVLLGLGKARINEALRRAAEENSVTAGEAVQITEEIVAPSNVQNRTLLPPAGAHLRLIETSRSLYNQPLTWRANDLALIPGLEFTAVRRWGAAGAVSRRVEFPPFPEIRRRHTSPAIIEIPVSSEPAPHTEIRHTPLEELAQRLERARIPIHREDAAGSEHSAVPEFVTDTMAAIYERQGAWAQAVKAYQILARNKPANLPFYQAKINELTFRISHVR